MKMITAASGLWWSSEETIMCELRRRVDQYGSQRDAARAFGVSDAYLSDVLRRKRYIGDSIAAALGYRRVTAFVKLEP